MPDLGSGAGSVHALSLTRSRLGAALPTLDIAEGALDKIFAMYKEALPSLGGYLTDSGAMNRTRLQARTH